MKEKKMMMDKGEIVREYNNAANKFKQVSILAELNCCANREMAEFLKAQGCEVDGRYLAGKKPKNDPSTVTDKPEEQNEPAGNTGAEIPDKHNAEQVTKDNVEQNAKDDTGKPRLTLVPMKIITDIAWVREYGNKKYKDPDNWKQVEPERYREAAFRHFLAYIDDPNGVDAESGLPHRWHLECNLAFLAAMEY